MKNIRFFFQNIEIIDNNNNALKNKFEDFIIGNEIDNDKNIEFKIIIVANNNSTYNTFTLY